MRQFFKHISAFGLMLAAGMMTSSALAQEIIIAPVTGTLTGDDGNFNDGNRTIQNGAANWFNGAGLSDASLVAAGATFDASNLPTHTFGNIGTNGGRIRTNDGPFVPAPELTFSLGEDVAFDVSRVILWNHGEISNGSSVSNRGLSNVLLSFSTDGGLTFNESQTLNFTQGPDAAAPITGQVVDFGSTLVGVTDIRFSNITSFEGDVAQDETALINFGELRFVGVEGVVAAVIPEPGSLAVLAIAGVGVVVRRRKRA